MYKLYVSVFLMLVVIGLVRAQSQNVILVSVPVHGHHVFEGDSQLILLNTFSGDSTILDETVMQRLHSPVWNIQGDRIAYNTSLDVNLVSPFSLPQQKVVIPYNEQSSVKVESWIGDGGRIAGFGIDSNSTYYDVQVLNLADQSFSLVRRDVVGASLAEDPQLEFLQTRSLAWNPVYEEWFAFQLDTFVEGTEENPERPSVSVVIVQNAVTGKKYLLNDLINDEIFRLTSDAWSPDGRQLVLETQTMGTVTQIITVLDPNGQWQFQSEISAFDMNERGYQQVLEWFGEGDLLLLTERDDTTVEQIYSIGQIIAGEIHLSEFFRIPITAFSDEIYPHIGQGDFHLSAGPEERHALSCLFDHAQPARFGIGDRSRVNFTTGTPLRLREAPSFNGIEITQMPEGTEFMVIGGPACVNTATDYYRFWQIELDDSTVGWAAEAGMSDYFMEPVPSD